MWKRWWEIPTCFSSKNFPSLKPHLLGLLLWTTVFSTAPASQRFLVSLTVSCQGGQSAARSLEQSASGAGSRSQSWEWFSHVFSFQSAVIFQESTDSCRDPLHRHHPTCSPGSRTAPLEAVLGWSSQTAMPFQGTAKNGPWCWKTKKQAYVSSILEGLPDSQRNQAEWHWNHTLINWSQKKGMHVRIHETSTVSKAKQEMWTTFPNILR